MSDGLTRHDVMAALEKRQPKIEPVELQEMGGPGHVREITPMDKDSFDIIMAGEDKSNWRAAFAVRVLCDEKGDRLFHDTDAAFIGQNASLVDLETLWDEGHRVSGIDRESMEEAEGNSDGAASGDSGSD